MVKGFVILGEPRGKERPKFTTINGHPKAITPPKTVNYESLVKLNYSAQMGGFKIPDKQPVFMLIDCFMAIPQSQSNKKREMMAAGQIRPLKKPDFDNVGKIICDSLNGIAYYDDAAVADARVRKFYSNKPRVEVFISDEEIDARNIDQWRKKHHD